MEVFLKSRKGFYREYGIYNEEKHTLTVFNGSQVSKNISEGTFRSSKNILKHRLEVCDDQERVIKDICFNSASSAVNFITGVSTNGLVTWKNIDGRCLKELIGGE